MKYCRILLVARSHPPMNKDFDDFCESNKVRNNYLLESPQFKMIYDTLINNPESIKAYKEYSKEGKQALLYNAPAIETIIDTMDRSEVYYKVNTLKQLIGKMILFVLSPEYKTEKKRKIPQKQNLRYFKNSAIFVKNRG